MFEHACKLGLEGIVSKRRDLPYNSGRSPNWIKSKNPNAPAVKREAEEDWGDGRPPTRNIRAPVTLGHIRSHDCRDLLVYCNSGRCHHRATMNADHLPADLPVRSLCGRMVCTRCGYIGADVRPDWRPHVNKRYV